MKAIQDTELIITKDKKIYHLNLDKTQIANDIILVGDVRNLKPEDFLDATLITAGSPCPDFSFCGKKKGMVTKDENIEILTLVHYQQLVSEGFEFKVMDQWKREKEQLFDQSSKVILYTGIAAAVILMINLCVTQNSMSLDALFGIADMNADNTSLLFYID